MNPFKSMIDKALEQQKLIKHCEKTRGHRFIFVRKQTLLILESEQTYDYYECEFCGLGKFE